MAYDQELMSLMREAGFAPVFIGIESPDDGSLEECRKTFNQNERFQYWRLLIWTFTRRPKLVPQAVSLDIYGHHFRKVSETLYL